VRLPGEEEELCDGVDNDCDGATDESFSEMGSPCGEEIGQCRPGQLACVEGEEICEGATEAQVEICDGEDNDCDEAIDEELEPDPFEPNNNCLSAIRAGEIAENNEPRLFVGSLYPPGDVDWFVIRAQEASNFCVLNDDSYEVTVSLSNLPADQEYEICLTVIDTEDDQALLCNYEDIFQERVCWGARPAVGGKKTLSYRSSAICAWDDTSELIVEIFERNGGGSCAPYTLSLESTTILEEE